MKKLNLQQDEKLLAKAQVQLAKGFPQTAGNLYLTNRRLILEPDQLLSLFCGEHWETPLSRIVQTQKLGHFQGETFVGSAGKKLVVRLNNSSALTFSFALWSSIDTFSDALNTQIKQPGS